MTKSVTDSSNGARSSMAEHLPTARNEESVTGSSMEPISDMVGWIVFKMIGMQEIKGHIKSYNSETNIYEVEYKNGRTERVIKRDLLRLLSPCRPEDEPPSGPSLRMNAWNPRRPAKKASKKRKAVTAPAQQSVEVTSGSADSSSERKKPYKSLRMNAER